jgi:hypothetical protein
LVTSEEALHKVVAPAPAHVPEGNGFPLSRE